MRALGGVVRTMLAAAVAVLVLESAVAAELRIGLKAPPTTLDPHHENFAPNLTLAQFPIIAAEQEDAPQAAFDDGSAAIGTGPFILKHHEPGQRVTLAANPSWWGGAPVWDRVEIHFVPDDVARVTALTEGRLDLVDGLSPYELQSLGQRQQVTLPTTSTSRVIYLAFDRRPGVPAGTTAVDGTPLAANPFDDVRVRRAVSLAVDRTTLVAESLSGLGQPAAQIVPAYLEGASPRLTPDPFDPQRARALLREAGYPDGFATRLACTEGRYLNDVAVCRAVALSLAGIGIRTEVTTHTGGEFFARAEKGEFPIRMAGWATGTGEASYGLRGLVMTHEPDRGSGMANASRYTNPAVDALVRQASTSFDAAERGRLLAEAMDLAMEDLALVPLYFQGAVWGARQGIAYDPPIEEFTRAIDVHPAAAPH